MSADIAIVGLACRFPGASGPAAFWRLLSRGESALAAPPGERLALCPDMPSRTGGYLENPALFDAAFFHISPREAAEMDPQQRIMLEIAWEAFEDAGCPADSLRQCRAAVYVGAMWRDYEHYVRSGKPTQHTLTGLSPAFLSGRISHYFGLSGPCMTVETSTSSSLVAVHLACQSLRSGEVSLALAGGVNLILSSHATEDLAALDVLSRSGHSRPFDTQADGYVRGEGAGAIVLKRAEDALRDGDRIHCLIRSTYVNHNAGGMSIASPSPESQRNLLHEALRHAGITPDDLSCIEAHGTGTQAGDTAELRALQSAFAGRRQPVYVGSVKGNIGHLEAAAGIAGLIKVCLMLRNRSIPATCGHVRSRSDMDSRKVAIPSELCAWEGPERAGVSSFGLMGTNAHIVLERTPVNPFSPPAEQTWPFVVSAQSEEMLQDYAGRLALACSDWNEEDLAAICATSLRRRTHLRCRRALLVRSVEELRTGLMSIAMGMDRRQSLQEWMMRFERGEAIDTAGLIQNLPLPAHVDWPVRPWDHRSFWTGQIELHREQSLDVTGLVAAVLGTDQAALSSDRTLIQLGLDSLMALELSERLKETWGVGIAPRHLLNGMLLSDLTQTCSATPEWEQTRL